MNGLGLNVILPILIVIFFIEIILLICYLKHIFNFKLSTVQYCRNEKKDSSKNIAKILKRIFLNNQWEDINEMVDILKKSNVNIEFELVEENEKSNI